MIYELIWMATDVNIFSYNVRLIILIIINYNYVCKWIYIKSATVYGSKFKVILHYS